ncbi:MAG: hypothetical protein L6455_04835 [Kiritimatiellae bacterium]|nr:hypothetical protein [Verrucomicrobiota bacterium]MCG2679281.1 hypothetical protein [Kiritimatiellia bacterium]
MIMIASTAWLKDSVLGIVILGSLGSLLAVLAVKIAPSLARSFVRIGSILFRLSGRVSQRRFFLDRAFIKEALESNNLLGLLLFVGFRFCRCILVTIAMWNACARMPAVWQRLGVSPKQLLAFDVNFDSGIAAILFLLIILLIELLLLVAVLDLRSCAAVYVMVVTRHLKRLKERHKDELAWLPPNSRSDHTQSTSAKK